MKTSWTKTFRRLAAGAMVAGATAFSSAMCYAQYAYDNASDGVYAGGWNAGQDGGFGFTPWNFDNNYWYLGTPYAYTPSLTEIDDGDTGPPDTQFSNPHNNIGQAWATATIGYIHPNNGPSESFDRNGRGFENSLAVGQTFRIVVDNPSAQEFYGGWFLRLNGGTGGINGNICNQGRSCTTGVAGTLVPQMRVQVFNFANCPGGICADKPIDVVDGGGATPTTVTVDGAAAGGMTIEIERTSTNNYVATITPAVGAPYKHKGSWENPGSTIDWFELTYFNGRVSDSSPSLAEDGTDFYIRHMSIVPEPGTFAMLVLGSGTLLGLGARRRREEG